MLSSYKVMRGQAAAAAVSRDLIVVKTALPEKDMELVGYYEQFRISRTNRVRVRSRRDCIFAFFFCRSSQ